MLLSSAGAVATPAAEELAGNGRTRARGATFSRPELNSLRFFAFLLVFYSHAVPFGWLGHYWEVGIYGVPIFFLLSAYLICTLLLRERELTQTIRVRSFLLRRVLRIWPLYLVALFGSYLTGVINPDVYMPRRMVLYLLLMVGNVYVARYGWSDSPEAVLWSLSVEEQFYLGIPVITKYLGRRGLKAACYVALLVSFLVLARFDVRHVTEMDAVWVNSFVCFQFFAVGALIACRKAAGLQGRRLGERVGLVLAGVLCFRAANSPKLLRLLHLPPLHTAKYVFILAGAIAIFFGFLNYPARAKSLPGYLGVISYGLYVLHPWCLYASIYFFDKYPSLSFHHQAMVEDGVALLGTVAVAALSYQCFERPILKLKRRFEVVPSQPV